MEAEDKVGSADDCNGVNVLAETEEGSPRGEAGGEDPGDTGEAALFILAETEELRGRVQGAEEEVERLREELRMVGEEEARKRSLLEEEHKARMEEMERGEDEGKKGRRGHGAGTDTLEHQGRAAHLEEGPKGLVAH